MLSNASKYWAIEDVALSGLRLDRLLVISWLALRLYLMCDSTVVARVAL